MSLKVGDIYKNSSGGVYLVLRAGNAEYEIYVLSTADIRMANRYSVDKLLARGERTVLCHCSELCEAFVQTYNQEET